MEKVKFYMSIEDAELDIDYGILIVPYEADGALPCFHTKAMCSENSIVLLGSDRAVIKDKLLVGRFKQHEIRRTFFKEIVYIFHDFNY